MDSYRNSDPRPPIMQGSPPVMVPPKLDWDRPPWNRWAFQHIREILPTAEVWRGNGHRHRLERAEVDLDGLPVEDSEGRPSTLAGLLDETYTDGFLVLKHGKIAYERYFNGMDVRTLHLSQSMAKSITGSVFGILAGRGLIDPARPVTDYLPELGATGWAGASVQHVLDMTTGVRFSEEYADRYSDIGQVDVATGWKPVPPGSDPDFRWPSHLFELILGLTKTIRHQQRILIDECRVAIAFNQQVAVECSVRNGTLRREGGDKSIVGAQLAQQRKCGGDFGDRCGMYRFLCLLRQEHGTIRGFNVHTLVGAEEGPGLCCQARYVSGCSCLGDQQTDNHNRNMTHNGTRTRPTECI